MAINDNELFEAGLKEYFQHQHIVYKPKCEISPEDSAMYQDISFSDFLLPKKDVKKEFIRQDKKTTHVPSAADATVFIKTLSGKTIVLRVPEDVSIMQIKLLIEETEGIPVDQLRLIFDGIQVEEACKLKDYLNRPRVYTGSSKVPKPLRTSINELTLHMILRLRGGGCSAYINAPDKFDNQFNFDFRNVSDDGKWFVRGGLPYNRPVGCNRKAILVRGIYESDAWLGSQGSNGEWAVAYHGSTDPRIEQIVRSGGLKEAFAQRELFGKGIYCTPDPTTALAYAKPFGFGGRCFKMIVQTRVNPRTVKVVPKAAHGFDGLDDYWVVPEGSIRIYGLCIYPA